MAPDEAQAERRGIDRRALIRRGVVVGGLAWTAPLIIESLTSPAAAATGVAGCRAYQYTGGGTFAATYAGTCTPVNCGGTAPTHSSGTNASSDSGLSGTGTPTSASANALTFTIAGGFSCTIVGVVGSVNGACTTAAAGSSFDLQVTGGALNSTSVTVTPKGSGGRTWDASPSVIVTVSCA